MANDYMDEPDDQQDAVRGADNGGGPPSDATESDDDASGEPVVIPKSACPGMDLKPGMRMSFVVDRVLEDEVTCHYVSTAGSGEAQPAPDESAMMMD